MKLFKIMIIMKFYINKITVMIFKNQIIIMTV